jgi:hypothetical protein
MTSPEDVKGEGFEILGHQEPEGPKEPGAEAEGEKGEETAAGAEKVRPLDVYAVLRICIAQFAAIAWQKMGLEADPLTKEISKEPEQARTAIDCAGYLVEKLMPHLQGQEAKDYQSLVSDLRLNFVKQAGGEERTESEA